MLNAKVPLKKTRTAAVMQKPSHKAPPGGGKTKHSPWLRIWLKQICFPHIMRHLVALLSACDSFRSLQMEFKLELYFILIALDFVHSLNLISVMKIADYGVVTHGDGYKKESLICFMCLHTTCSEVVSIFAHFFSKTTA